MKIVYVDMDDVLANFTKKHKSMSHIHKYPQSTYGFFADLEPIDDSIFYFNKLKNHFDMYILTAPSVKNPLCYTEKRVWIESNLGEDVAEKLIISPFKNLNKGDYLIDDNTSGKGQDKFEGELLHFGSEKFPGWKEIYKYLMKKENIKDESRSRWYNFWLF